MDQLDFCIKCGNSHEGSCSTEAIYFHWFPQNSEEEHQDVYIIGDWTKWSKKQKMTKISPETGSYYYSILLALNEGTHQYKFIVDGLWKHDRHAATTYNVYGTLNNIVDILPKKNYMRKVIGEPLKFTSNFCINGLKIVGSWDNWDTEREMTKTYNPLKKCEENVIYFDLQPNKTYQFKFKHRNQYFIDEKYPTVSNIFGTLNNIIIVYSNQIHIDTPLKNQIKTELGKEKEFNGKIFTWRKIPEMINLPYQRIEGHTMCCIGEYIYIFGGKSRNQFYNTLLKINFSFDKLQFEEIYPDGRAFHIMKPYGNKIIIYGGNNQEVLQDYQAFNVSNRKWHATPNISRSNSTKKCEKQSCVLYQTLLIFFGGCYNAQSSEFQQLSNQIEVLDLQKMQWIQSIHAEGEQPPSRFAHTAQMINSFMYVFGGVYDLRNNLNLNDLWRINLLNVNYLRWQKTQPRGLAPQARHGHSMNSVNSFLIVFGGINDRGEYLNDVLLYNSIQNEWITPFVQGGLPKARYNHASTNFLDNQILIFGGRTAEKERNNQFYLLEPSDFNSFNEIAQNSSDECE